ncbi:AbgT family transporter [Kocuria sp. TGY1127_2]|uniref:AbgT family transporter n=1 Tax=Kocuria sp. TGY1127_2 TaxID=2711328 RepID=UPI001FAB9E0C|nr:AbgT family transporter [Kocuria sp. TGY1127_2]
MAMTNDETKTSLGRMSGLFRAIESIERVGNRLPHPFWLFWILAALLGGLSLLLSSLDVSVSLPESGEDVQVKSLLSLEGLSFAFDSALDNFAGFPALAIVLVIIMGVSVAEKSGALEALLRLTIVRLPGKWITFAIAFTGMISHVMGDSAYLVMIPLGAMAYRAVGRSPVLGIMVAYVSVSAGFNASPVVTPQDAIRSALSTAAAQSVDPDYVITPVATYFFGAVSSLLLAVTITLVVELFLSRRPDLYTTAEPVGGHEDGEVEVALSPTEVKSMRWAGATAIAYIAMIALLALLPGSPMAGDSGFLESPVIENIGVLIALLFALVGVVYGRIAGTIPKLADVPKAMAEGVANLAEVIVLFFAAAQFLAYFEWTGIGSVITVNGASLLERLDVPHLVVIIFIIVAVSFINMIVTSGSAMWAIFAPVIMPMMMYYGMAPEAAQVAFMIGDSTTNAVTPMSPFFVLALGFVRRYKTDAGIGTLASFTIPVSLAIFIVWSLFFVIWYALGIPLGPGVHV